jgi:hypothetical protein
MIDISQCLGQRVLVSINDGPPIMTSVAAFTPSGQYVWLRAASAGFDETVGWRHVAYVQVLETFGASSASEVDVMQKLEPAALSAPASSVVAPVPVLTVTST